MIMPIVSLYLIKNLIFGSNLFYGIFLFCSIRVNHLLTRSRSDNLEILIICLKNCKKGFVEIGLAF